MSNSRCWISALTKWKWGRGQLWRLRMESGLIGSAEAVHCCNRKREGKTERPSSLLCKAGRCKWLYYSRECNSYNQLTGEPMRMLFIISENGVTVLDWVLSASGASTEVQHVALGWFILSSYLFHLTHFCSPLNEQCVSCVSTVTHRREDIPPTCTSLWDCHPKTPQKKEKKSRFQSFESKRCIWCKKPLSALLCGSWQCV